jgi:hypothetical protein
LPTDLKLKEESLVIRLPLRYIKMAEIKPAEISAMKKLSGFESGAR